MIVGELISHAYIFKLTKWLIFASIYNKLSKSLILGISKNIMLKISLHVKVIKIVSSIFLVFTWMFLGFISINFASADSWWGYGYRPPNWILQRGGSIIRFEIDNISGGANEYKVVLYDKDGDYVEKEFGTEGLFDDAKDANYTIRAYRGGVKDKTTYKGGKEFAKIKLIAHPGETIELKFNYKKGSAKISESYFKFAPKPVAKPIAKTVPAHVVQDKPETTIEIKQDEEVLESSTVQTDEMAVDEQNSEMLTDFLEEYVHPDAMAQEPKKEIFLEQGNFIQQEVIEKKPISIFKRIWFAILDFFTFN